VAQPRCIVHYKHILEFCLAYSMALCCLLDIYCATQGVTLACKQDVMQGEKKIFAQQTQAADAKACSSMAASKWS